MGLGIPAEEIDDHKATPFGRRHASADLVLVAELQMKHRLLDAMPELHGRVMTIRGFVQGFAPGDETLTEDEVLIPDAGGHTDVQKLVLYAELEDLAEKIVNRLLAMSSPDPPSSVCRGGALGTSEPA